MKTLIEKLKALHLYFVRRSYSLDDMKWAFEQGMHEGKLREYYKNDVDSFSISKIYAFVISCRLQGKGIGSTILGLLINMNNSKVLESSYKETEYNQGMKALFEWYKFNLSVVPVNKRLNCIMVYSSWIIINYNKFYIRCITHRMIHFKCLYSKIDPIKIIVRGHTNC
jgi:hypothetical protein